MTSITDFQGVMDKKNVTPAAFYRTNRQNLNFQPRSLGCFSNFIRGQHSVGGKTGIFNGLTGEHDLPIQADSSDYRHGQAKAGENQKPKSPFGHIPLSIKIIFGTLAFATGCYGLLYTFLTVKKSGLTETNVYALGSAFGIFTGIAKGSSFIVTGYITKLE